MKIIRKTSQVAALNASIINVHSDSQTDGYSCDYINNLVQSHAYPVGSIYLSVNNTSPETLFGGTWVQLKDKFLLTAGDTYTAGDTGGEATHTLTVDEIPSHAHEQLAVANPNSGGSGIRGTFNGQEGTGMSRYPTNTQTGTTGGGQAHNNMPPYIVVYAWYRTA